MPGTVVLVDVVERVFSKGAIRGYDIAHNEIALTSLEADLDIYIAGFMCSPFSSARKREGFHDEAPRTCFACLKTIVDDPGVISATMCRNCGSDADAGHRTGFSTL